LFVETMVIDIAMTGL